MNDAVMGAYHRVDQGQTEARSFVFARQRAVDLRERLEHLLDRFGRESDAGVAHRNGKTTVVRAMRPHCYASAVRREFDRIGEQVHQHLLDHALVAGDFGRA